LRLLALLRGAWSYFFLSPTRYRTPRPAASFIPQHPSDMDAFRACARLTHPSLASTNAACTKFSHQSTLSLGFIQFRRLRLIRPSTRSLFRIFLQRAVPSTTYPSCLWDHHRQTFAVSLHTKRHGIVSIYIIIHHPSAGLTDVYSKAVVQDICQIWVGMADAVAAAYLHITTASSVIGDSCCVQIPQLYCLRRFS
jgi:hypothetical protein